MAYLERPAGELPDHDVENDDNQVAVNDEISLYDYAYGISDTIYSEIENASGSSANAESLPAVEMAYSRELGLPPVPDVYDRPRMILPEYVNTKACLLYTSPSPRD